jgi:hypothetical protein
MKPQMMPFMLPRQPPLLSIPFAGSAENGQPGVEPGYLLPGWLYRDAVRVGRSIDCPHTIWLNQSLT